MTEDRKEPTLSPLKPEQDEIVQHRQRTANSGNTGRTPTATRTVNNTGHGATGKQRPVVVKSSKLAPFAFLLAITGLGLAGFSYWQLMEAQKETQAAVARIAELESRLEMTGDESEASLAAVQAKLKWADSEIRKLWGVAYDTNRKAIAANENAISAVNKKMSSLDNQVTAGLNNLRDNLRGDIRKVSERLEPLQHQVNQFDQTRVQLQQQTQQVADTVRQVRESQSALRDRVSTNEQAIEAIDTFRRSVNQDLLQLKAQKAQNTTP